MTINDTVSFCENCKGTTLHIQDDYSTLGNPCYTCEICGHTTDELKEESAYIEESYE